MYKWTLENTAVQVAAVLWEVNDKPIQTGSVIVIVVEPSVCPIIWLACRPTLE